MDQLDVAEVRRRSKIIFELAKKIAYERNREWIGWKGEVLFDEISEGIVKGRNFAYKPVVVDEKVRLGQRMQIEITNATTRGLYGVPLS